MAKIEEKNKGKVRSKQSNISRGRRVTFDGGQRADLQKKGGLSLTQVEQLDTMLSAIAQRLKPPIPSSSVRDQLSKLKKALILIRRMPERPAGAEALTRLQVALTLTTRSPQEVTPLQNLLAMASAAEKAVDDAIAGLPKFRGKIRRSSPMLSGSGELITLILKALQTGRPATDIGVSHAQFLIIAGIVRDATGSWSVEEAIYNYRSNLKVITAEEKRIEQFHRDLRLAIGK